MPATPYDAKGLMTAAIKDPDPVVFIDDRWLHAVSGHVPEEVYEVEIGEAIVRKEGSDATLVAASYMAHEAEKAALELAHHGIDIELIDLQPSSPWMRPSSWNRFRKTGRLIVADGGWKTCGLAAWRLQALVSEKAFEYLQSPRREAHATRLPGARKFDPGKGLLPESR